jgi:hypothetical protein
MKKFVGRFIAILRISIGDLNFDASTYLDPLHNTCYWIVLIMTIVVTAIVFLNFIIAEVSASY